MFSLHLTHISLASFLGDICQQNSRRCDAAKRGISAGTVLFVNMILIKNEKFKPDSPKNENGLIQMIMMGKCFRLRWVKVRFHSPVMFQRWYESGGDTTKLFRPKIEDANLPEAYNAKAGLRKVCDFQQNRM